MPLGCDCYPGCWAEHSEDWQRMGDKSNVGELYKAAVKTLPYGTYVCMSDHMRVETQELMAQLAHESNLPS